MPKYTGILLDNSVNIHGMQFSPDAIRQLKRAIDSGTLKIASGFTIHQSEIDQDGVRVILRASLNEVSIIPNVKTE
jgi:hypothetical protein